MEKIEDLTGRSVIKYASLCQDANSYYMDMSLYDTPEEAEQTSDFVKVIEVKI